MNRFNLTFKAVFATVLWVMILAGIAIWVTSCARVTVNPNTGDVSYLRIGNQNISGMKVKTPTGWEISFDQESKTEALKTALSIAQALK